MERENPTRIVPPAALSTLQRLLMLLDIAWHMPSPQDVVVVLPKNAWPQLRDAHNTPFSQRCGSYMATLLFNIHHCVHSSTTGPHDEFALFCVFDGHNGVLAAKYISETLLNRLVDKLPTGNPPEECDEEAFATWRQHIVRALAEVLSETHLSFAKLGQLAGCTVTIVLQVGVVVTHHTPTMYN